MCVCVCVCLYVSQHMHMCVRMCVFYILFNYLDESFVFSGRVER